MRKIHLHRAAATNAGAFVDAGNDIGVGPGDDHIVAERADELVKAHGAVELIPLAAKAPAKRKAERKPKAKPSPAVPVNPASTEPVAPISGKPAE